MSYALGAALLELGVEPAFLAGHSVGEFAAAVLAEVLTLDEAARLVVARGQLMQQLPAGGAMSAVDVPADDVAALVAAEPSCGIAAVNGPRSTVVSGPAEAVDRITRTLAARGAKITSLAVSHAFHSPLMAPAQAAFRDIAGAVTPRKAKIPLVSTLHGRGRRRHRHGRRLLGRADHLDRPVRRRDRYRHRRRPHPPTSSNSARGRPCWPSLAAAVSARRSAPWRRAAGRTTTARVSRGSPRSYTPTG